MACNPSSEGAEARESPVPDQPGLQNKTQEEWGLVLLEPSSLSGPGLEDEGPLSLEQSSGIRSLSSYVLAVVRADSFPVRVDSIF